jgi:hypothetical protein
MIEQSNVTPKESIPTRNVITPNNIDTGRTSKINEVAPEVSTPVDDKINTAQDDKRKVRNLTKLSEGVEQTSSLDDIKRNLTRNPSSTRAQSQLVAFIRNLEPVKDLPDFSEAITSPILEVFKKEILKGAPGGKNYKYGMSGDVELKVKGSSGKGLPGEEEIDCSGAVCKVVNALLDKEVLASTRTNAQKLHKNYSTPINYKDLRDGDIITMGKSEDEINHIGIIVIDERTNQIFIAESARSFKEPRVVPLHVRLKFLEEHHKEENIEFKYYYRRLNIQK